jgi:hypothetical protein
LQKGSETKGAGQAPSSGGGKAQGEGGGRLQGGAASSGGNSIPLGKGQTESESETPSERLRLTDRPAVKEEVKTEEVAVKEENALKEENPLQKGSQICANKISETDADNEQYSSSKRLEKEHAKVVFPFGMNPVVMPANSPVEVPLEKGHCIIREHFLEWFCGFNSQ